MFTGFALGLLLFSVSLRKSSLVSRCSIQAKFIRSLLGCSFRMKTLHSWPCRIRRPRCHFCNCGGTGSWLVLPLLRRSSFCCAHTPGRGRNHTGSSWTDWSRHSECPRGWTGRPWWTGSRGPRRTWRGRPGWARVSACGCSSDTWCRRWWASYRSHAGSSWRSASGEIRWPSRDTSRSKGLKESFMNVHILYSVEINNRGGGG